jgi:hypothetical protein
MYLAHIFFVSCYKEEETQLQWTFERVPASEHFPLGVKTTYRAWVQDEVIEIVKSPDPPDTYEGRIVGLNAIKTHVVQYPLDNPNGRPDGMFLLKAFPSTTFKPRAFEEGSRADLEKTLREFTRTALHHAY